MIKTYAWNEERKESGTSEYHCIWYYSIHISPIVLSVYCSRRISFTKHHSHFWLLHRCKFKKKKKKNEKFCETLRISRFLTVLLGIKLINESICCLSLLKLNVDHKVDKILVSISRTYKCHGNFSVLQCRENMYGNALEFSSNSRNAFRFHDFYKISEIPTEHVFSSLLLYPSQLLFLISLCYFLLSR